MGETSIPDAEFSFLSAGWFAAASCIPVAFVCWAWITIDDISKPLLFIVLPVLTSAFCGFSFGASIIDPNHVKSSKSAAVRGIKVAFWSYGFFSLLLGLGMAFYLFIYERTPENRSLIGFVELFFNGVYLSLSMLLILGWLIIPIGAVAGLFLFRIFNRQFYRSGVQG